MSSFSLLPSAGGHHTSGATIGVAVFAVLAVLFALALLGAAALWFFARRRLLEQDMARGDGWGPRPPYRAPVGLATRQAERRA
jgi:hypothetical protein